MKNKNFYKNKAIKTVDVKAYKQTLEPEELKTSKKVYGVKDKKIGFIDMLIGANDTLVLRNFSDAVNRDTKAQLYLHAEDFEMWKLGEIEDDTGNFIPDNRKIATASDLVMKM